jgi:phage-related protein
MANGGDVVFHFKGDDKDLKSNMSGLGSKFSALGGIVAKGFTAAVVAATAAVVGLTKKSVEAFAEFEQLQGGLESMLGAGTDGYKNVMQASEEAYKSLQMSQNQYLKAFESSYAIIKNNLSENADAIEYTNKMLGISSDLFNTYGGSIEQYQNAINWALKGTFSYLDNLNIGIKGTQKGFVEAANASGVLGREIEKVSELTNDEILNVIEYYTQSAGALGRSAMEAEKTLSGSINMLKGSWQNLLTAFSKGDDLSKPINDFIKSLTIAAKNVIPVVIQALKGIAQALPDVVTEMANMLPGLINDLIPPLLEAVANVVMALINALPTMLDSIVAILPTIIESLINACMTIINGIIAVLPTLLESIVNAVITLIPMIVNALIEAIPLLLQAAIQLLMALVQAIPTIITELVKALPTIITSIVTTLMDNYPTIMKAAFELLIGLVKAIPQIIIELWKALPDIISTIIQSFKDSWPQIKESAVNMFNKFIEGIGNMIGNIRSKAEEIISNIGSVLGELPGKAIQWGKDMIQGFADGIMQFANKIVEKVQGIAEKIKGFLHFSRPDEGPLRDYESWMPDFIGGLTKTLHRATPMLVDEVQSLSDKMQIGLSAGDYESIFDMSPELYNSNTQSSSVNITIQNNMETDMLGNLVNNIKTYSNGSRQDFNYGIGG